MGKSNFSQAAYPSEQQVALVKTVNY